MKFAYEKFPVDNIGSFASRPVLTVVIENPITHRAIGYKALLDSGADINIFPAEIAEILGLDMQSGKLYKFGGIGSAGHSSYVHKVNFIVGGSIKYETECAFSYEISKIGYGVLGQKGFFDHFVIKFDYSKKEIEIKENKK